MNFKLTDENDLAVEKKPGLAGGSLALLGGKAKNGIMESADEIAQTIKNEFLLYLNETPALLGRGTAWFDIFKNSKQAGIQEFRQEISRILLSVRSVSKILDLAIIEEASRKFSVIYRVSTRKGEIAEGEIPLN